MCIRDRYFVELQAKKQRKRIHAIAPAAMALLRTYRWPGNVRELSNVIERAVILASEDTLLPAHLPAELELEASTGGSLSSSSSSSFSSSSSSSSNEGPDALPDMPTLALTSDDACQLERATLNFHRQHIARVLDRCGGSRDAAAKLLGLSPATFYRYLQKVGLRGYNGRAAQRPGEGGVAP